LSGASEAVATAPPLGHGIEPTSRRRRVLGDDLPQPREGSAAMAISAGWGPAARTVLVLAGLVIVVVGIKVASSLLGPIILGAFFAVVSYPVVAALRRRGLPNWAAIAVTCLGVVAVLAFVGIALYSSLSQFSEDLPTFEAQMAERTENVDAWLQDHGVDASDTLGLGGFTGSALSKLASRLISAILNFLSSLLLLLMLTVFFLVDAGLFVAKGERQIAAVEGRWPALAAFVRSLQRFFAIKSIENAIIASGMVLLIMLFDVPFPLLWGILGFFLSYIPSIGLILACIPPVLLAYATSGITAAVVIAIGVTIINQVGDNVILPLMVKKGLDMSLSIQFVSFLVWTWILGPVGAILALPLTMVVRLILMMSERTRWLGDWLAGGAPKTEPPAAELEPAVQVAPGS
jgi:AI-2 transport protein TqsA